MSKTKAKVTGPKIRTLGKKFSASKALAALKLKFRDPTISGLCAVASCKEKSPGTARLYCKAHKKAIRKMQLKLNNITWKKRKAAGKAGNHVVYDGAATKFAVKNTKKALVKVTTGHASIKTKKELDAAIAARRKADMFLHAAPKKVTKVLAPKSVPVINKTPTAVKIPVKHIITPVTQFTNGHIEDNSLVMKKLANV